MFKESPQWQTYHYCTVCWKVTDGTKHEDDNWNIH